MLLKLENALNNESIMLLGALLVKQLQIRGACTFFVNLQGVIELSNPTELALDSHPEDQAILLLVRDHQYTDEQLVSYLRGREARLSLVGGRVERGVDP